MPPTVQCLNGQLCVSQEPVGHHHGFEAATTQTDDSYMSSTPTSVASAQSLTSTAIISREANSESSISTDDDTSEADSVFDRLTRSVGRLFHQERRDRGTQTAKDPLASETEKLAFDTVFFALGKRGSHTSDDVVRCMRQCVTLLLERHPIVFDGMMSKLNANRDTDLHSGFIVMSEELFPDNVVSWGKIMALFAFGAKLARYYKDHNMGEKVYDVATTLSQFAVDRITPFVRENGGWATILELFPVHKDYETKIWRSLILTGIGLTAIATFLAWQR